MDGLNQGFQHGGTALGAGWVGTTGPIYSAPATFCIFSASHAAIVESPFRCRVPMNPSARAGDVPGAWPSLPRTHCLMSRDSTWSGLRL